MTDEDFREYWNELDVSRRMRETAKNIPRMNLYRRTLETGTYESIDQAHEFAAREVFMSYGRYGSSKDFAEDDVHRPLPHEVEDRVIRFQQELLTTWATSVWELERAGSLNALYRESLG